MVSGFALSLDIARDVMKKRSTNEPAFTNLINTLMNKEHLTALIT